MADELRGPRGEYDWWGAFVKGHGQDMEDALLRPLAELGDAPDVDVPLKALNPAPPVQVRPPAEPEDVTTGMSDEEVNAQIHRLTNVNARPIGFNPINRVMAFGYGVTPQLRDLLIDAWAHYQDHECVGGRQALDRLLEQLVAAMAATRGDE